MRTQSLLAVLFALGLLLHPALLLSHETSVAPAQDKRDESLRHLFQHLDPWLAALPDAKRKLATATLMRAEPRLLALQNQIRQKMTELRALRYDKSCSPETLPRLGRELISLRDALKKELARLQNELCAAFGKCPELMPRHRPTQP